MFVLKEQEIGQNAALFYRAFAQVLEGSGEIEKAADVFEKGIARCDNATCLLNPVCVRVCLNIQNVKEQHQGDAKRLSIERVRKLPYFIPDAMYMCVSR